MMCVTSDENTSGKPRILRGYRTRKVTKAQAAPVRPLSFCAKTPTQTAEKIMASRVHISPSSADGGCRVNCGSLPGDRQP